MSLSWPAAATASPLETQQDPSNLGWHQVDVAGPVSTPPPPSAADEELAWVRWRDQAAAEVQVDQLLLTPNSPQPLGVADPFRLSITVQLQAGQVVWLGRSENLEPVLGVQVSNPGLPIAAGGGFVLERQEARLDWYVVTTSAFILVAIIERGVFPYPGAA